MIECNIFGTFIRLAFMQKMEGTVSSQEEQKVALEKDFAEDIEGGDEHVVDLIEETAPRIALRTMAPLVPSSFHQVLGFLKLSSFFHFTNSHFEHI
jgi:hypothetical protein